MRPLSTTERQYQACGLLPPIPGKQAPVIDGVEYSREVCPGYLTSLPEVVEAIQIRPQWLKGGPAGVREYVGPECRDLGPCLNAQAILDGSVQAKQNHETEKRAKEAEARRGQG